MPNRDLKGRALALICVFFFPFLFFLIPQEIVKHLKSPDLCLIPCIYMLELVSVYKLAFEMLSIKKANLSLHNCKLGILVLNRYTIVIWKGKVIR